MAVAIWAAGCAAARFLYRRFDGHEPPRIEFLTSGALTGLCLWIAANWALAIPRFLTRGTLVVAIAVFAIGGLAGLLGAGRSRSGNGRVISLAAAIAAAPVVLWCCFVLWRGSVVPPASHDALTYHLPRAIMMARAHGFERFDVPDERIRMFPANYELLLSDVMMIAGNDRLTEWLGTAAFLLFLAVAGMYARRWWGRGPHVAACVLAAAGAPLLLLHSGHDKNDLFTAAFAAAALFWAARWCVDRGSLPAIYAIVFGMTAVGFKTTALACIVAIAPFALVTLIRRPPPARALFGALALAAGVFLLCGGWVFAANLRAEHLAGTTRLPSSSEYGYWSHLWLLPYLAVRVSLGLTAHVPWTNVTWPWPGENVFSSHYGLVFGVAALALPFCVWRYGFRRAEDDRVRERLIVLAASIIGFALLAPLAQYPQIALPSILRYTAFVLPVVLAWTVAPVIRDLGKQARWKVSLAMGALLVVFAMNAFDVAVNDSLAPLAYARWCAAHPGTREIYWMSGHAESVADRLAESGATIAVHGGRDAWIYPAYGADLSRRVVFVRTPAEVPADAEWVVVDEIPATRVAAPSELAFFEALERDGRYRLVYRQEGLNQAVFRRVR